MSKKFRPYSPNQIPLLPPALQDWLPKDHLIDTLSDIVDSLDLSPIIDYYERELRGYPPYHPVMMTKVLIYTYSQGVYSSRKIENRLHEDVAFRVCIAVKSTTCSDSYRPVIPVQIDHAFRLKSSTALG